MQVNDPWECVQGTRTLAIPDRQRDVPCVRKEFNHQPNFSL